MAVAGVIAEYNPFHRGHAWQLEELRRRLGTDVPAVACMSGNFVQRGDFALLNKHSRAEMALMGGVDLVLELPTPWAAAGAERFAQGAVAVLAASGVVTHLAFGCESGELAPLQAAAEGLEQAEYPEKLREIGNLLCSGQTAGAGGAFRGGGMPLPAQQCLGGGIFAGFAGAGKPDGAPGSATGGGGP